MTKGFTLFVLTAELRDKVVRFIHALNVIAENLDEADVPFFVRYEILSYYLRGGRQEAFPISGEKTDGSSRICVILAAECRNLPGLSVCSSKWFSTMESSIIIMSKRDYSLNKRKNVY